MRPRVGRLTLVFLLVVGVGLTLSKAFAAPDPAVGLVGSIAPEVVITEFDGSTWRLSNALADGPVVLNLWASYCVPCVEEIPELSRFATARPDVTVAGAAVRDDLNDARAFAEQLQPDYIIGMDATDRLRDALPTVGLPSTFVIDNEGTIIAQFDRQVTSADLTAALR